MRVSKLGFHEFMWFSTIVLASALIAHLTGCLWAGPLMALLIMALNPFKLLYPVVEVCGVEAMVVGDGRPGGSSTPFGLVLTAAALSLPRDRLRELVYHEVAHMKLGHHLVRAGLVLVASLAASWPCTATYLLSALAATVALALKGAMEAEADQLTEELLAEASLG